MTHFILAKGFESQGNFVEAIKCYERALESIPGHNESEDLFVRLALMLSEKFDTTVTDAMDMLYFRKDIPIGQIMTIALNYQNGTGVTRNPRAAIKWYIKAYELQHTQACLHIAHICEEKGSFVSAVIWNQLALDNGHPQAKLELDRLYNSDNLHAHELNKIGMIYHNLCKIFSYVGVKPDYYLAKRWYKRAIVKGSVEAVSNLQQLQADFVKQPELINYAMKLGMFSKLYQDAEVADNIMHQIASLTDITLPSIAYHLIELQSFYGFSLNETLFCYIVTGKTEDIPELLASGADQSVADLAYRFRSFTS